MEFRQLRSFIAVAASGSVSGAARQMSIAQPAVSHHIRALEAELGVVLFERNSRGVTLTEAGLALLAPARDLIAVEVEARGAVARMVLGARTEARVAMIPTMAATMLPATLLRLKATAPRFQLHLFERAAGDALALLAARLVDFAVVRDTPDKSGFDYQELFSEPLVLAVGDDHPLARATSIASFKNADFIMFDAQQNRALHRKAMEACARAGFVPRVICEGPEIGSMGSLVAAGAGVAIAPASAFRLWNDQRIQAVSLGDGNPQSVVQVATLPGEPLSVEASRVIRVLQRVVGDWAATAAEAPGSSHR
jgi:DNA-binding transcriptional LysR family regulator